MIYNLFLVMTHLVGLDMLMSEKDSEGRDVADSDGPWTANLFNE